MTEGLESSKNTVVSILLAVIFIVVVVLAMFIIFGVINTTSSQLGPGPINFKGLSEIGFVNSSGYSLNTSSISGFSSPSISAMVNYTSGLLIQSANYTVNSNGLITNQTSIVWSNVSINYTYQTIYSSGNLSSSNNYIQNSVVSMILNAFSLLPTMGTILAVIILIGVIVLLIVYVRNMASSGQTPKGEFNG